MNSPSQHPEGRWFWVWRWRPETMWNPNIGGGWQTSIEPLESDDLREVIEVLPASLLEAAERERDEIETELAKHKGGHHYRVPDAIAAIAARAEQAESEAASLREALEELNEATSRYPLPDETLAAGEGTAEHVDRICRAQDQADDVLQGAAKRSPSTKSSPPLAEPKGEA